MTQNRSGERFSYRIQESDPATLVAHNDGIANAGESPAKPLFSLANFARVLLAQRHLLEDVISKEDEADSGQEAGQVDTPDRAPDAPLILDGPEGLDSGLILLHLIDHT